MVHVPLTPLVPLPLRVPPPLPLQPLDDARVPHQRLWWRPQMRLRSRRIGGQYASSPPLLNRMLPPCPFRHHRWVRRAPRRRRPRSADRCEPERQQQLERSEWGTLEIDRMCMLWAHHLWMRVWMAMLASHLDRVRYAHRTSRRHPSTRCKAWRLHPPQQRCLDHRCSAQYRAALNSVASFKLPCAVS